MTLKRNGDGYGDSHVDENGTDWMDAHSAAHLMMICQQPRWHVIQYGPTGWTDKCQSVKRRISDKCIVYNFSSEQENRRTRSPKTEGMCA